MRTSLGAATADPCGRTRPGPPCTPALPSLTSPDPDAHSPHAPAAGVEPDCVLQPSWDSLTVTPVPHASSSPSFHWETSGSYVKPMEKKGRIPFPPLSFICALLLLKNLFRVQFGETPYCTYCALRKPNISLTRS